MDGYNYSERSRLMKKHGYVRCDACYGCGQVADRPSKIPWIIITQLLTGSDGAPTYPGLCAVRCNKCSGTGMIVRDKIHKPHKPKPKI